MNRKIIFIDIDGTLLGEKGNVPATAKTAIRKARDNGHLVYLCTGRVKAEITPDILEVGFDGVIAGAGSYIEIDNKVVFNNTINESDIKKIVAFLEIHQFRFWLEGGRGTQASEDTKHNLEAKNKNLSSWREFLDRIIVVEQWDYTDINKLTFIDGTVDVEDLAKEFGEDFHVEKSSFKSLGNSGGEITLKNINKASGIKFILEYLNIPLECSMAYGDGFNDIQMLQYVNKGIAMMNACNELKEVAADIANYPDEEVL